MYCGKCHSGTGPCGCSWEEDDGDGGWYTLYGRLSYFGKICSQAEWDQKIAAEEAEEERQEAYAAKEKALNEKYQQELRQLPTIYKLTKFNSKTGEFLVAVPESNLYFDGGRLDLSSVQEINRSFPCNCNPECREAYGGGYLTTKDGKRLVLKNWQKKGFWPWQKDITYRSLWGNLTVMLFLENPGRIHGERSVIDISYFLTVSIYTPTRREILGE